MKKNEMRLIARYARLAVENYRKNKSVKLTEEMKEIKKQLNLEHKQILKKAIDLFSPK
jgi:hypothetical protein